MSDYTPTGAPADQTRGASGTIRSEFQAVATAIATKSDTTGETYSGTHDFSGATLVAPGKSDVAGETYSGTHDFSGASVSLGAATMTADVAAGGHKITDLANPTNPSDAANLQTVQALISGGGTPANIPITSLGKGTATANQLIRVNAAGTALEGVPGWINAFSTLTGAATLAAWQPYRFNTSGVTYSLPISPADGDECLLVNAGTNINNVLSGNGRNIVGPYNSAASVNMNVPYGTFHVKYDLTSTVWRTV